MNKWRREISAVTTSIIDKKISLECTTFRHNSGVVFRRLFVGTTLQALGNDPRIKYRNIVHTVEI